MQGVFSVNFESFTIYNVLGDKGQIIWGGGEVYAPIPPGFAALVLCNIHCTVYTVSVQCIL